MDLTDDTTAVASHRHSHSHNHSHDHGAHGAAVTEVGALDSVAEAFLGDNLDNAGFHAQLGCCGCC